MFVQRFQAKLCMYIQKYLLCCHLLKKVKRWHLHTPDQNRTPQCRIKEELRAQNLFVVVLMIYRYIFLCLNTRQSSLFSFVLSYSFFFRIHSLSNISNGNANSLLKHQAISKSWKAISLCKHVKVVLTLKE